VTESAGVSLAFRELADLFQLDPQHSPHHHLADPIAAVDGVGSLPMIDHHEADLAAIVGIHRAGGIEQRDAVLRGQAAARANLRLSPRGQRHRNARPDQGSSSWRQGDGLGDAGAQIQAGGAGGCVGGQSQVGALPGPEYQDLD
jgi:hypothetical protein